MKNVKQFGVEEISNLEIDLISGGGWLYDLGAAAHELWCDFKEGLEEFSEMPSGGYAGMGYYN